MSEDSVCLECEGFFGGAVVQDTPTVGLSMCRGCDTVWVSGSPAPRPSA